MAASLPWVRVTFNERRAMNTFFTVVVFAFVLAVPAVVAYALFEMSPFARHADHFRDPRTGRRRGESPHLD
jgi:hypothetical protein